MRYLLRLFFLCFLPVQFSLASGVAPTDSWTLLIYVNAKNHLEDFAIKNIIAMEKVGSNDHLNIIVEYGSYSKRNTVRMRIEKSLDPRKITSPILQDLGEVDMGSYKTLQNFIDWGIKNYPADHYFIDVWDHGTGWHLKPSSKNLNQQNEKPVGDISYDDITGNHIKTEELGTAINHAAAFIGHKVDIYGSDACLMGTPEVADEMSNAVDVYVGSEAKEQKDGWPYDKFLADWSALKQAHAEDIAKTLVKDYAAYYQTPGQQRNTTLSAMKLANLPAFNTALKKLQDNILELDTASLNKIFNLYKGNYDIDYSDYKDAGLFFTHLKAAHILNLKSALIDAVLTQLNNLIIISRGTGSYENAMGASIWMSSNYDDYQSFTQRYEKLAFNQHTHWNRALALFVNSVN